MKSHHTSIMGLIQLLGNVYTPNTRAPGDLNSPLTDLKGNTNFNTITIVGFQHPTFINEQINQTDNQQRNSNLYYEQEDLLVTYRTFHPTDAEYAFFSSVLGTQSYIDHMPCVLSDHLEMKLANNSYTLESMQTMEAE